MARERLRRAQLSAIQFERWDIEGVDLNFEMHHGELNINAITRCLAEAEAFAKKDALLNANTVITRRLLFQNVVYVVPKRIWFQDGLGVELKSY